VNARLLRADGSYTNLTPGDDPRDSQKEMMAWAKNR